MGKALVITEKPSVARDIVAALGNFEERDGGDFWESDQYVVSYAVGHILGLVEPEEVDEKYRRWSLSTLPIIPEKFNLKVKSGQKKRLDCLKRLIKRKDVDSIINGCDAAREGELIFREITEYCETKKPIKRLWLQSMTKTSILGGLNSLRAGEEVEGLWHAAACRSHADWLIGMNATRALSIRLRTRAQRGAWSAGRVQTPTLGLLVDRELEILDFVPEPYWKIKAKFKIGDNEFEGSWYDPKFKKDENRPELRNDRIFEKDRADAIIEKIQGKEALSSESRKLRKAKAPTLFNLTGLQKNMSNRYGWSAKRTLQAAQRCYESHKVLTYPRTSSSVLPEDYKGPVDELIGKLANTRSYGPHAERLKKNGKENEKQIFNDAGVTDHFAIIPTGEVSTTLSGDDLKVYDTVVRRFLAAFHPPAVYDKVDRTTIVESEYFRTGPEETLVEPGWVAVYEKLLEEKMKAGNLVPLVKGKKESSDVPVKAGQADVLDELTKPPARIGEARLLSLMEHAGRHVDDEELAEALNSAEGLGTAATRADIIENLKVKEYVTNDLRPTPKGIRLIDVLHRVGASRLTSAELTAGLEKNLHEIEAGKSRREDFMSDIGEYVAEVVDKMGNFDFDEIYPDKDPIGECPLCKDKKVYEKAWFYACESNDRNSTTAGCGLLLWKDIYGRYMNRNLAKTLLTESKSNGEVDGFRNGDGQSYKAELTLEGNRVNVQATSSAELGGDVKFEVNETPLGTCPIDHKSEIIETPTHFISKTRLEEMEAGSRKSQGFILPRMVCKREMTREEALEYMKSGETQLINDFISKRGRRFRAKLKMKPDGRHEFEFPPREVKKKTAEDSETQEAGAAKEKTTKKKTGKKKAAKKASTKKAATKKKLEPAKEATDPDAAPF